MLVQISPLESHQSIGGAEGAHGRSVGILRTLVAWVEDMYGIKLDSTHVLIPWMTRHSACLYTWFSKNLNGKTPHQELRGTPFEAHLLSYAEKAMWQRTGDGVAETLSLLHI